MSAPPSMDLFAFAAKLSNFIRPVTGAPTAVTPTEPALAIDTATGHLYAYSRTLSSWVASGAGAVGNGTVGAPSVAFSSDSDTGLYRVAANTLGVAAGGVAAGQFTAGQFGAVDGSVSAPAISFANDTNTGFYRPAADNVSVVAGGVQVAEFTTRQFAFTQVAQPGGSSVLYSFQVSNGAHTMLASSAETGARFALSQTIQFNATGGPTIANQSGVLIEPPEYEGSGAPGVTITNMAALRILSAPSVGSNMTATNRWALQIDDGASLFGGPVHVEDGTAAEPSITFNDDRNTGIYRAGADQLGFAVNGVIGATLSESAFTLSTKYVDVAEISPPSAPAANTARLYVDDSGGKTRLIVRFPTGAVQVLATEP